MHAHELFTHFDLTHCRCASLDTPSFDTCDLAHYRCADLTHHYFGTCALCQILGQAFDTRICIARICLKSFQYKIFQTFLSFLVSHLSHTLGRIQQQLDDLVPLVNKLNNLLPGRDRLEPFIIRPIHEQEGPDYDRVRRDWSDSSSVSSEQLEEQDVGQ